MPHYNARDSFKTKKSLEKSKELKINIQLERIMKIII